VSHSVNPSGLTATDELARSTDTNAQFVNSGCMLAHRISSAATALMSRASSRSCQKPLSAVKLGDLQTFADSLQTWAQLVRARWRRSSRCSPLASAPAMPLTVGRRWNYRPARTPSRSGACRRRRCCVCWPSSPTTATGSSCACCTWPGCASGRSSGSDGVIFRCGTRLARRCPR